MDIWDGSTPGTPEDTGHLRRLRDVLRSSNAFKNALRHDVDAAVLGPGCRMVTLEQNRDTLRAFFRPVFDVMLCIIRESRNVQYWSAGDRPPPPTTTRETPMDGEAFRLNKQEVVRENGPSSFFLGLHVYSDATHNARSCSMLSRDAYGRVRHASGIRGVVLLHCL